MMFAGLPINILTQSLWRDEAFSALLSLKSLDQIIKITAADFSPPLYYFFLHFWVKLVGWGEVALRIPSVFFLILAAGMAFLLGRELFSSRVGRWAAVLVLLNPLAFYYAFEARMYLMLTFLAAAAFFCLITERWFGFVTTTLLGLYCHNFMVFALVGFLVAYIYLRGSGNRKPLILSLAAIFLGFVPWLGILFSQLRSVDQAFWIARPGWRELIQALVGLFGGPNIRQVPLTLLFGGFWLVILGGWFFRRSAAVGRRGVTMLLLALVVPIAASFLVSLVVPLFVMRYLVFAVVPLAILLAAILTSLPRSCFWLIGAALLFFFRDVMLFMTPDKFPIRETVQPVAAERRQEPVICESILNFFEVKYYLRRLGKETGPVYLLSSGQAHYAGGALLEPSELLAQVGTGPYFLITAAGEARLVENLTVSAK